MSQKACLWVLGFPRRKSPPTHQSLQQTNRKSCGRAAQDTPCLDTACGWPLSPLLETGQAPGGCGGVGFAPGRKPRADQGGAGGHSYRSESLLPWKAAATSLQSYLVGTGGAQGTEAGRVVSLAQELQQPPCSISGCPFLVTCTGHAFSHLTLRLKSLIQHAGKPLTSTGEE